MKKNLLKKLLSLVLAAALLVGYVPAVGAASGVSWKETDLEVSLDLTDRVTQDNTEKILYNAADIVRVSIVLEKKSTVQAGFSTADLVKNEEAMEYNKQLRTEQDTLAATISRKALGGKKLDVVWNLTLVGNVISANVPYGKIGAIEAINGVRSVVIEQVYEPCVASKEETAAPQMYISGGMIGSGAVWNSGYTGAGSRIAVIDTGTDTDHQSFDNGAFIHALRENAEQAGMTYEDYIKSLDLLDLEEIKAALPELNIYERDSSVTAADLYGNEKLAFGYNYIDGDLDLTHDNDDASEHGSHVAGISTANRYIPVADSFVDALETVYVAGVAPDAQLITLKVFGKNGGAYDSDYMAAIEDAIILGCDAVNLSLGSSNPGYAYNDYYSDLLAYMEETDTVVVASAGNSGSWADNSYWGYLYPEDVSLDTVGSPGSYGSFFTVASVQNAGTIGYGFEANGVGVAYTEGLGYGNAAMATLDTTADHIGTTYEYVLVTDIGAAADYEGIDLTDKIVFCSRGITSFADKANVVVENGGIATVVYNNASGVFGMNLSGYNYEAPCVSIQRSEAAAILAASTEKTTEAGNTYYTGSITVYNKSAAYTDLSDYYTMSSFSSWGVPGDLSIKPEVTAPGGAIYSVYGSTPYGGGSDQYELMSGTSMAAPQITGMVALIAQYLRETGLAEKAGMSPRDLAQSLLMSTAEPLREEDSGGNYYSILNQGAGLGRVDLATSADSYILVNGQEDGKVKVELGDDPQRTGVYEFSFTVNNLSGEEKCYTLSADVFRQDVFEPGDGTSGLGFNLLDTWTADLPAESVFAVNGASLVDEEDLAACDLNGDGETNEADADYLLEYLMGNETELMADGDLNGDGEVNTYDAHMLLATLKYRICVRVPAGGSAEVEVTLTLTEDAKEFLDTYYPNGTYVEAFVMVNPVADEEGAVGVTHSIPVLGFYGSWSESSMYDKGTYMELAYGTIDNAPYLYDVVGCGNALSVDYGDGTEYYFGGNPIVKDATYLPARNAMNSEDASALAAQYFTLIRNAADSRIVISDAETGTVYLEKELGKKYSAYYHTNAGAWQQTVQNVKLGWTGTDADGKALAEGTKVNVSLIAAPSYYRGANGSVDFSALADGAYLTTPITIDNTAPKASEVYLELLSGDRLIVRAKDNQYVAAAVLLNSAGTTMLTAATPNQTVPNTDVTVALDISEVTGKSFLLAVYDYAKNATVYEIELGLGEADRPYFTVVNADDDAYTGLAADGTSSVLATGDRGDISAAEYVDGYVFEISNGTELYVASDEDLTSFQYLRDLDPDDEWAVTSFVDLAYNAADGKLYGLFYSGLNAEAAPILCTVDMLNGTMEALCFMPVDVSSMAIDEEGNFYSVAYNSTEVYTYTVASVNAATPTMTLVGETGVDATKVFNSLAWDPNTDELYWAYPGALMKIDHTTGVATKVSDFDMNMVGLYIRPVGNDGIFAPTNVATGVSLDQTATRTLVGQSIQLTASVWPWTATDRSVTWSSSDKTVATVDENGVVTGVSEGEVVITATSNLDSDLSADCAVTVIALDKTLNGVIWDETGDVWWSEFAVDDLPNYTKLTAEPCEERFTSAAVAADGTIYAATVDTSTGYLESELYEIDPETFAATLIAPIQYGSSVLGASDIAYAPNLAGGSIVAGYGGMVLVVDPATGALRTYYSLFEASVVGIAYVGSQAYSGSGLNTYVDWFFLTDNGGTVYLMGFLAQDGKYYKMNHPYSDNGVFTTISSPTDISYFNSLHYDGDFLFWSAFNSNKDNVTLLAIDTQATRETYALGAFADGVWPAGALMEPVAGTGANSLIGVEITGEPQLAENNGADIQRVAVRTGTAGKLNSAVASKEPVADLHSDYLFHESTTSVSVDVTVPYESTNGVLAVAFDTEVLEFSGIVGKTENFAYSVEDGVVKIAYAAADAIAKDSVAAKLTFKCLKPGAKTEVMVETVEVNDMAEVPVTIEVIEVICRELFDLYGANMKLTSDLTMNFYVEMADITRDDLYAEISRNGEVMIIPMSDWEVSGSYYKLVYPGIAAKEMTDEIVVTLYDSYDVPVSNPWTDSVRSYVMRVFERENKTLLVDMLNYGAAAQENFNYKTKDLANSLLTAEQSAYASGEVEMTDGRVKGENYYGSSLTLEYVLSINLYFSNVTADMKAVVTYTNHNGVQKTIEKSVVMSGFYGVVHISELALADAGELLTCKILDAEGNVVAEVTDSIESYCARTAADQELNVYLMRFCKSVYNAFHPNT